ncbi:DUF1223 domain-containing protein [Martelella alba]|uniref:DUF1223 domain-containing protein n=1 Tax=Martelella alba TaxID=2590451 RepID=A0A506U964_9HYPH|nr:DUF1223 domain-containing protein [Martelella alba]TPW30972.1 DUF1223 domain-containing protein [Martelella alba]
MVLKHAIAIVMLLLAASATAGEISRPIGVVELFTSQGCSSCPPADRAMADLADRDGIIVLTYHVDYWNYLGWSDTMSTAQNTQRQYGYGHTMGRSGVYTPQVILNGRQQMKGTNADKISATLAAMTTSGNGPDVPISAHMNGDELDIHIGAGTGKADVVVVYFASHEAVKINAGENKGKIVDYRNIVNDIETVAMWNGSEKNITLPARVLEPRKSDGCAILLQKTDKDGNPAAILGAALLTSPQS